MPGLPVNKDLFPFENGPLLPLLKMGSFGKSGKIKISNNFSSNKIILIMQFRSVLRPFLSREHAYCVK